MKYVVAKSTRPNFGDDLNGWLWRELFPHIPEGEDPYFIGIGTILHSDSDPLKKIGDAKKIVFGAGIRPAPSYTIFRPDPSMDIKFVRGPLSAAALDNKYPYITDAAYAIRHLDNFQQLKDMPKKYDTSLVPYFLSDAFFDWKKICKDLGYHYISPVGEKGVEFTLQEIASSRRVISEAMHGAIVADLLRVPWHRFILSTPHTEGEMVAQFKWTDWQQSVNIYNPEVSFIPFYKKTRLHELVKKLTGNIISTEYFLKSSVRKQLMKKLAEVKHYYLSDDQLLFEIDIKLAAQIKALQTTWSIK